MPASIKILKSAAYAATVLALAQLPIIAKVLK